jgi:poly-gamma-glutamate synthesis protein (capsule biosynthesis protein)
MSVTILGVGDVGASRADMGSMFAGIAPAFGAADAVFGQLETVVSERGEAVPNARLAMRAPPALAPALAAAGFTAMSFAGNHCLDFGYTAFRDTLAHLDAAGIALAGAGETVDEARRPVFVDAAGTRIAFIAANAILPEGYGAQSRKPGCAPLRAYTIYEQIEHDQPHTPARISTYCDRDDLDALCAAIAEARASADLVIVSLHWGIHMVRGSLADYQREAAHALIEAGCDAIFGHHPHILKGVELHRGRPIFYSLGNFAIEQPHVWDPAIVESESYRHLMALNGGPAGVGDYRLPEETRLTGIAELTWDGAEMVTRFRPCWIADDNAPHPLDADDPRFARIADYLQQVSADEGLSTRFGIEGGTIIIAAN